MRRLETHFSLRHFSPPHACHTKADEQKTLILISIVLHKQIHVSHLSEFFFPPSLSFSLDFQKALIKNTKKNAYRLECVELWMFFFFLSPVFRHIYRLYRIFVSLTELTIHKFIRIVRSQGPSHKYHNGLHCFLHRTEMGENYHLI